MSRSPMKPDRIANENHICSVKTPDIPNNGMSRAVSAKGKTWDVGQVVSVYLFAPTAQQRSIVEAAYNDIQRHANLIIAYATKPEDAHIRWAFKSGAGSWSYVGTDALYIRDKDQPTVNIGWGPDYATVCHEALHSVGFLHEHQNPDNGIKWDKEKVYDYFMGAPNYWDKATIDRNILNQLDPNKVNYTRFDRSSIMLYFFSGQLTVDGQGTTQNRVMSNVDKLHLQAMYPKTEEPEVADFDVKEVFGLVFDEKRRLHALTEDQLLVMCEELEIKAKKEDLKKDTVAKIWSVIES